MSFGVQLTSTNVLSLFTWLFFPSKFIKSFYIHEFLEILDSLDEIHD